MKYKVSKEEKEFLSQYSIADFERPSVVTDIVVFRVVEEAEKNKTSKEIADPFDQKGCLSV